MYYSESVIEQSPMLLTNVVRCWNSIFRKKPFEPHVLFSMARPLIEFNSGTYTSSKKHTHTHKECCTCTIYYTGKKLRLRGGMKRERFGSRNMRQQKFSKALIVCVCRAGPHSPNGDAIAPTSRTMARQIVEGARASE